MKTVSVAPTAARPAQFAPRNAPAASATPDRTVDHPAGSNTASKAEIDAKAAGVLASLAKEDSRTVPVK